MFVDFWMSLVCLILVREQHVRFRKRVSEVSSALVCHCPRSLKGGHYRDPSCTGSMQVFNSAGSLRCQHPGCTSSPVQNRLKLCQGLLTRRPIAAYNRRCIVVTKGIFDAFLGRKNAQEEEGPTFEAIDPESDGGLGGTSEDLFGPLVTEIQKKRSPAVFKARHVPITS